MNRRPHQSPPTNSEWQALSPLGRWVITCYCLKAILRPRWPFYTSLGGSVAFGLFWFVLPEHPLSLSIGIGAGLSVSLIARGIQR